MAEAVVDGVDIDGVDIDIAADPVAADAPLVPVAGASSRAAADDTAPGRTAVAWVSGSDAAAMDAGVDASGADAGLAPDVVTGDAALLKSSGTGPSMADTAAATEEMSAERVSGGASTASDACGAIGMPFLSVGGTVNTTSVRKRLALPPIKAFGFAFSSASSTVGCAIPVAAAKCLEMVVSESPARTA